MRMFARLTWLELCGALAAVGLPILGVVSLLMFG
jgi:hypothetical protein